MFGVRHASNTLKRAATHCNTLQHTATPYTLAYSDEYTGMQANETSQMLCVSDFTERDVHDETFYVSSVEDLGQLIFGMETIYVSIVLK